MISRLVLNLRSPSGTSPGEYNSTYLPKSAIKFVTRTIGDLGGTMDASDQSFIDEDIPLHNRRVREGEWEEP